MPMPFNSCGRWPSGITCLIVSCLVKEKSKIRTAQLEKYLCLHLERFSFPYLPQTWNVSCWARILSQLLNSLLFVCHLLRHSPSTSRLQQPQTRSKEYFWINICVHLNAQCAHTVRSSIHRANNWHRIRTDL